MGRVRELTRFTVRTRPARTEKHGRTACASKVSGPGIPRKEQKKASVHFLLAKNLGLAKISSAIECAAGGLRKT